MVSDWLVFDNASEASIDPGFGSRLEKYAKEVLKRPLVLAAGYRTYAEQKVLYELWKAGKGNYANPPGTSWHEYRMAVDVRCPAGQTPAQAWPEIMKDYIKPPEQQAMRAYGLYIESWAGSTVHEWWHLMPYEIHTYTGVKSAFRLEEDTMRRGDNSPAVLAWQMALDELGLWPATVPHNTNFGPTTESVTKTFKAKVNLPTDGIVDNATWGKMTDALRTNVNACEALQKAQAEQIERQRKELDIANARISGAKAALG